jgi:predicted deacetylase
MHDVMPETLDETEALIGLVRESGHALPSLLIVPGRSWDEDSLARVRGWANAGHELVGHGWSHRAAPIRGLKHRLHSAIISRNAAEHLSLDTEGIAALIRRCARWFTKHGLPSPSLYVPPAWALGRISRSQLTGLGFRYYETLTGIYDSATGKMHRIPVAGFEADTLLRVVSLRVSNAFSRISARRAGALRIAIHPEDLKLRLAGDLRRFLRRQHHYPPCAASISACVSTPEQISGNN